MRACRSPGCARRPCGRCASAGRGRVAREVPGRAEGVEQQRRGARDATRRAPPGPARSRISASMLAARSASVPGRWAVSAAPWTAAAAARTRARAANAIEEISPATASTCGVVPHERREPVAVAAGAGADLVAGVALDGGGDPGVHREQDELVERRLVAEPVGEGDDVVGVDLDVVEHEGAGAGELLAEAVPVVGDRHPGRADGDEDRHDLVGRRSGEVSASAGGGVGPLGVDRAGRVVLAARDAGAPVARGDLRSAARR